MDSIEFRARCPHCQTERSLFGPFPARTPAELDAIEALVSGRTLIARCPACNCVELVAMFVDGLRAEEWQDADECEQQHGPGYGPLPPKPWPDTN